MMTEPPTIAHLILSLSFVVGGFFLGIIFERIIIARLRAVAAKTKWKVDSIVINALHGMTTLWFIVAGVYLATHGVPLKPNVTGVLHKALLVIAIISVTWVLAKIAAGFVGQYAVSAEGVLPSTSIFANLTRLLVFLIGILILLQSLGISVTPLLTALSVGGLAVALALQETLSNLIAGFHIIASKQVRPGDFVQLDTGEDGYVTDINWRNTTIRALQNNMIVVPNSKLAAAIVRNFYLPEKEMSVRIGVGVSYDSDLEHVEEVTLDVAKEVMQEIQGAIPGFDPVVRYHTFADSSINFNVILRAKEFVDQYPIKHEFMKRLHKRYKLEGIEIPFPIRTVHLKELRREQATPT